VSRRHGSGRGGWRRRRFGTGLSGVQGRAYDFFALFFAAAIAARFLALRAFSLR